MMSQRMVESSCRYNVIGSQSTKFYSFLNFSMFFVWISEFFYRDTVATSSVNQSFFSLLSACGSYHILLICTNDATSFEKIDFSN